MSDRIGIAIEADVARAVVRSRSGIITAELPWDPARPQALVDALRAQFGNVGEIALSVGLGYLAVARPELPPLAAGNARRVLLRDADRYFPIAGPVAIATSQAGGLAFATASGPLRAWVAALEQWAPVRAIVASPTAVAAALAERSARPGVARLTMSVDAGVGERGLVSLAEGRVVEVRRLPEPIATATLNGAQPLSDATLGVAPGRFAAAVGALAALDGSLDGMLLDAPLDKSLAGQRRTRWWRSAVFLVASLAILAWGADQRRERTLQSLQQQAAALSASAAPAYASRDRLARADAEQRLIAANAGARVDALTVLAILSRALPAGVVVQRIEWDGREWRVDGSADDAAQIVPRLDAEKLLENVHPLGASTRFRDIGRTRESFSVSFRVREVTDASR